LERPEAIKEKDSKNTFKGQGNKGNAKYFRGNLKKNFKEKREDEKE